ncbi:hypothetical protein BDZ85DRAFT_266823 [Elsinoe ampelina]|uniref:Uncharacterized protein n=1 Tax=Elsinoe ampelina TaxID=302913 RepID=A0A6A6G567_9PEZI|nr:hypothetical protein BDZ85DRAFT_266823 [Elsinoe ampelina]
MTFFNALIRTHHITSRKKVMKLKQATRNHDVFALLRSGGAPGIMYVEGPEQGVRSWIDTVHGLRYKDYQLAIKPAEVVHNNEARPPERNLSSLREVDTVKEFSVEMKRRGLFSWWRKGMGYENDAF